MDRNYRTDQPNYRYNPMQPPPAPQRPPIVSRRFNPGVVPIRLNFGNEPVREDMKGPL